MTFIPTSPLVAKAVIEGLYQGETIINTMWFEKIDEVEWDTGSLANLLDGMAQWWSGDIGPLLNDDLTISRFYASRQDSPTSVFAEKIPIGMGGGVIGEGLPANVAVSVKFATNIMGRSYRGRNFIGGLPAGAADGSTLDATFKANLVAAYGELFDTVYSFVEALHVVVSKYSNKEPRTLAVTVPVTSYAIRKQKVNTMRSRVND